MGRSWILKLREGRARTCVSEAIRRTPPAHDAVRAGMLSGTAGVGAGGRTWRERVVPGTNGSEEAADSGDPAACSSPALAPGAAAAACVDSGKKGMEWPLAGHRVTCSGVGVAHLLFLSAQKFKTMEHEILMILVTHKYSSNVCRISSQEKCRTMEMVLVVQKGYKKTVEFIKTNGYMGNFKKLLQEKTSRRATELGTWQMDSSDDELLKVLRSQQLDITLSDSRNLAI